MYSAILPLPPDLFEMMIAGYVRAYGLRALVFRYFNVAGADPAAQRGKCVARQLCDILSEQRDTSARRPLRKIEKFEQRGLARSGRGRNDDDVAMNAHSMF